MPRISGPSAIWRSKGLLRTLLLLAAAAAIATFASTFGISRDYGYLRASLLTGDPRGQYYALASRLAARAKREHGRLTVLATAGSIENITRLSEHRGSCTATFAPFRNTT